MSTFDGVIKEYPLISIDNFLKSNNFDSTVFFLSHCHTDHMKGLKYFDFFQLLESRCFSKIYLSDVSEHIIKNDDALSHLSEYLVTIPLEQPTIIPVPNKDGEVHTRIVVTLLTAGHCPGSVMFYIEGENGKILYTGDFRLPVGGSARLVNLHDEQGRLKPLDALYVDTTFCNETHTYFPTREQSLEAVESLLVPWLGKGPDHVVSFICPANYNYEFLFVELFKTFGEKVHVSEQKLRKYKGIKIIEEAVTCIATESKIHACGMNEKGLKVIYVHQMPCGYYTEDGEPVKVRYIKPCAMSFKNLVPGDNIYVYVEKEKMYKVCFSTHSSLSEVRDLVHYLKPKNIYPNVVQNQTVEEILDLINAASPQDSSSLDLNFATPLGILKRTLSNDKIHINSSNSLPFYDDYYKVNQKYQTLNIPSVKSSPIKEVEVTDVESKRENLSSVDNSLDPVRSNNCDISPVKWQYPLFSSDDENCDPNSSYDNSKDRSDSETTYGTSEEQEYKRMNDESVEKLQFFKNVNSDSDILKSLVADQTTNFVKKSSNEDSKESIYLRTKASKSVDEITAVYMSSECNDIAKKSFQISDADLDEKKCPEYEAALKLPTINVVTNKYLHSCAETVVKLGQEEMKFVKPIVDNCDNNSMNKTHSPVLKSLSVSSSNIDGEIKDLKNYHPSHSNRAWRCNKLLIDVPENKQLGSSSDVEIVLSCINSKSTLNDSNLSDLKNKKLVKDNQAKFKNCKFSLTGIIDLVNKEEKNVSTEEKLPISESSPIQHLTNDKNNFKTSFYNGTTNNLSESYNFKSLLPSFGKNCDNNQKKDSISSENSSLKCTVEYLCDKSNGDKFIKKLPPVFTSKAYSFSQKLLDISASKSERECAFNKKKLPKNSKVNKSSIEFPNSKNKCHKEIEVIDLSSDDSVNGSPIKSNYSHLSSKDNNAQKNESHYAVIDSSSDVEVLDSSPSLLIPSKFRKECVDSKQHLSYAKRKCTENEEFSSRKSPKLDEEDSPDIFEAYNDVESTPEDLNFPLNVTSALQSDQN
ncbi:protein artemis [Trichonephila inaurata madagascariensis]|uniref:Protein artemis n=1 Tax=Trichonephila inaurata madagascariensis TaxID=2747483 RepID=A0A8X7C1Y3_9ARAC|nr:protein artemis [Trichonephila inaurata madagascariensis]